MTIVPADTFTRAQLATLFTAGYEGYFVPVHVDETTFTFMVDAWDIDLARSRVALRNGEHVGIVQLGVRGDRGWIGGLGVVPSERRRGTGRALMEAVLADAPPVVSLEVIEQNEAAIRLYEDLGFDRTRILEVWSLPEVPFVEARSADPAPLGQHGLPWQREDASLPPGYERLEVDGGALLLRGKSVLQLDAPDEQTAAKLLSRGSRLQYVNVPEGDPASAALRRLGGTLDLRQLELILRR